MTMTLWRRPRPAGVRSTRVRFVVEGLEERTVLSALAPMHGIGAGVADVARAHHHGHALAHARGHGHGHAHSQMAITGLVVNEVTLGANNQFVANATLSGTIKGHAFSLPIVMPVSLTPGTSASSSGATPAATTPTQVLQLSLGPVNLSLLGLNVHLGSTCTIGATNDPITATVTAIPSGSSYTSNGTPYAGGLLGDLLIHVDNLLSSGGALSSLGGLSVPGVTGSPLDALEADLTQALNGILGGLSSGSTTASSTSMAAAAGQHEVLSLDINKLNLDVLGALIQTSNICLNITATKGPGNLLGNLLG